MAKLATCSECGENKQASKMKYVEMQRNVYALLCPQCVKDFRPKDKK